LIRVSLLGRVRQETSLRNRNVKVRSLRVANIIVARGISKVFSIRKGGASSTLYLEKKGVWVVPLILQVRDKKRHDRCVHDGLLASVVLADAITSTFGGHYTCAT
jgi:hypothetical protein